MSLPQLIAEEATLFTPFHTLDAPLAMAECRAGYSVLQGIPYIRHTFPEAVTVIPQGFHTCPYRAYRGNCDPRRTGKTGKGGTCRGKEPACRGRHTGKGGPRGCRKAGEGTSCRPDQAGDCAPGTPRKAGEPGAKGGYNP